MGQATEEYEAKQPQGPFHIINKFTKKFAGPFTTDLDARMAKTIATEDGWLRGEVLDKVTFDIWLKSPEKW